MCARVHVCVDVAAEAGVGKRWTEHVYDTSQ